MLTSLALVAALGLAPAQTGDLELNNIRSTYGLYGGTRPDNKILPGDIFFVAFDIDNIQVDDGGNVLYSMGMEVLDSKKKLQYKQDPSELNALNSLGGTHLPAFAHVDVGLDLPAGLYTMRVTVTDRKAKKSKAFERPFEVLDRSFGLVRMNLSSDPQNMFPSSAVGVAGQSLWVHFFAVGFERAGSKKEADIALEMHIVDENNKPTLAKPFPGDIGKNLPADVKAVPMDFPIFLNRPGKFTAKLKATDKVSKKSAELSFPITVLEAK